MAAQHINRLPPEMLMAIFGRLSAGHLLTTVPHVCQDWYRLAQATRHRLRFLTLVVGERSNANSFVRYSCWSGGPDTTRLAKQLDRIQHFSLTVKQLPVAQCEWIVKQFPGIIHLELYYESIIPLKEGSVHQLLMKFAPQLHSLALYCAYEECGAKGKTSTRQKFDLLEAFFSPEHFSPKFKRLTLASGWGFRDFLQPRTSQQLRLPILAQLESFCLTSRYQPEILATSLHSFAGAQNRTLHNLEFICSDFCIEWFVRELLSLNVNDETANLSAITSHVTRIGKVPNNFCSMPDAEALGRFFTNLTTLAIRIGADGSMRAISSSLAKLTQLHTLHIKLHLTRQKNREQNSDYSLTPLNTVRTLILETDEGVSDFPSNTILYEELQMNLLLPNLTAVHFVDSCAFWYTNCKACGYVTAQVEKRKCWSECHFRLVVSLAAMLGTFDLCPKLQRKTLTVQKVMVVLCQAISSWKVVSKLY